MNDAPTPSPAPREPESLLSAEDHEVALWNVADAAYNSNYPKMRGHLYRLAAHNAALESQLAAARAGEQGRDSAVLEAAREKMNALCVAHVRYWRAATIEGYGGTWTGETKRLFAAISDYDKLAERMPAALASRPGGDAIEQAATGKVRSCALHTDCEAADATSIAAPGERVGAGNECRSSRAEDREPRKAPLPAGQSGTPQAPVDSTNQRTPGAALSRKVAEAIDREFHVTWRDDEPVALVEIERAIAPILAPSPESRALGLLRRVEEHGLEHSLRCDTMRSGGSYLPCSCGRDDLDAEIAEVVK